MEYFYINDKRVFTKQLFTVMDLITFFNLNLDLIVIEYNKLILPRVLWETTVIKNLDEIEFVTIVGGG
jgi:thiamine biosynthesis protein ThiS